VVRASFAAKLVSVVLVMVAGVAAVADPKGEVIEIHETWHEPTPPKVIPGPGTDPRNAPPYSDEALEKDVWVRAWVKVEIDEHGDVRRVKFLKRPGYGLEDIALRRAFATKYAPAVDEHGKPMAVYFIYKIEWPSVGWLNMDENSTRTRHVPWTAAEHVPCAGSGPWHMDSKHPVYRDCSVPDPKHEAREPWLRRTDHRSPWIDAPLSTWESLR